MDNINERTRTVTWEDPMTIVSHAGSLSGLEFLQAMMRGEVPPPPFAMLLGFQVVEVSEGRAVFTVEPQEFHYNPIGMVHGGLICTLLDSVMGCAVHTTLPAGVLYTTLDINVNFIRPLSHQTGLMRAEGEVIHAGRRTATAQARMIDANGKLYAHATTTCMIFRPGE